MCIFFLLLLNLTFAQSQHIKINQIGYLPTHKKIFFVSTTPAKITFLLKDISGTTVYSGKLTGPINDVASGDFIYTGDFTAFTTTGTYYVEVPGLGRSYHFDIAPDVYNYVFYKIMKSYYLQRCGTAVEYGVFKHGICHQQDGIYHPTTGQSGTKDVRGGWHDAGNYEKYISPTAFTCAVLLWTYEFLKDKVNNFSLNIPESENTVCDLLDETRYGLEWMLKMQRSDGAVYHCVAAGSWAYWPRMPENHTGIRYIMEVTSVATADFAAVMAIAARVFRGIDDEFADKCLQKAELAWRWLEKNPNIVPIGGYKTKVQTDTYEDNDDRGERFWAACELYRTTGKDVYNTYIINNHTNWEPKIITIPWWGEDYPLGMLSYYYSAHPTVNMDLKNSIKRDFLNLVNRKVDWVNSPSNGYKVVLEKTEYYWGSNSNIGLFAMMFLIANDISPDKRYVDAALDQVHYLLGRNAIGKVFISGVGDNYVRYHHYCPSISDAVTEPWPGFVSGGPNSYLSGDPRIDTLIKSRTPPAKCFIDDEGATSWASNEPCIVYNAPWGFVFAYFLHR